MTQPRGISFVFIWAALILTGCLGLGTVLLTILFSYLALRGLHYLTPPKKWPAIALFLVLLGGTLYGLAYFVQATVGALPTIAQKSLPVITQWAASHRIFLPFSNFDGLKDEVIKKVTTGAQDLGAFFSFARGATTQLIYFIVGVVVSIGIFVSPHLETDAESRSNRENLFTLCCEEISLRFSAFYQSFALIMKAQVIIAAIDTTLTGIFVMTMGLSYVVVAIGVTFLCAMIPMVGNLISNTLILGLGFMQSPTKGLIALGFLMTIHQLEYILNSRIVGGRIKTPLWLTFLGLVVGEALMGITGMILAPAILNYVRVEVEAIRVKHKEKHKSVRREAAALAAAEH